ncbi:hypothetical protein ITJ57_18700 [Plantibacter sp. VKM Ac-2880]|nr:hypothetical protein [Plantibacter sp. VKM Ac-2880]
MSVIAFASFAGSPGVSTAVLAAAVHWPRPVLVLEADIANVSSAMPGFFRANLTSDAGMHKLAYAQTRGLLNATNLIDPEFKLAIAVHELPTVTDVPIPALPDGHRMWVVPGFLGLQSVDGTQALWRRLPGLLSTLSESGIDVLVDLGRVGRDDVRSAIIDAADQLVVMANSTMVDLNRLHKRFQLPDMSVRTEGVGRAERMSLILVKSRHEPLAKRDFDKHILPVLAELPFDPDGAAVFSLGRQDPKPERNEYRQAIRRSLPALVNRSAQSAERMVG